MNSMISSNYPDRKSINISVLVTILTITAILLIYHQTAWTMVATWYRSDTYAHGFLIMPFVIYMLWVNRESFKIIPQKPSPTALIGLCALGVLWLVAELASVQVVTQYALVAMLPLIVAVILGYRIMVAMAFPLAYLFFAVPFGDILIPPLINFTADFTVWALQLSNIPVYREGTYFSLPTGNWPVVEACSGLRYLIASVTLGTLYAYLTYRSLRRRLIFIAFSIIVPIFANGVRAYLIVMTGHLSDMTLAVGVDHLIYGWVFFGFVMLLLFWMGSFWREDNEIKNVLDQSTIQNNTDGNNSTSSIKTTMIAACAVVVVSVFWPIYAAYLEGDSRINELVVFDMILPEKNWQANEIPETSWEPIYIGNPGKFYRQYVSNDYKKVNLFITHYSRQKQGDELINSGNILVSEYDPYWRIVTESKESIEINSKQLTIHQTQIKSSTNQLLTWRWYMLGEDDMTISPYMAKVILARNRLFTHKDAGAEIILATQFKMTSDEAMIVLEQFLADMLPDIERSLAKINDEIYSVNEHHNIGH